MKPTTKLTALLCTIAMLSPVCTAEACFFRNKKDPAEETVLPEDIPPRRGNGEGSYDQRNPKRNDTETADPAESANPAESAESPESAATAAVPTAAGTAYNWYCPHRTDGNPPAIPSEMSFIEQHGGYFLDHGAAEGEDKVIYLTFDAGYENGNIARILDTLKTENVPAAFFVLEHLVTANTDLVKRMAEEGHTVCNHTARHRDMSATTDQTAFAEELAKLEQIYRDATGCEMAKYYRPPEGRFSELNLRHADALGYKTIFWSFAYADWDNEKQMPAARAMEKVLGGTHNGEILLLHPTSSTNAEILPELIRAWKDMGYRFGTLDELTKKG